MTNLRYRWTCPHCGLEQPAYSEVDAIDGWMDKQVVVCDVDMGGCDQYVVLAPKLTITAKTYKLVEASADDPVAPQPANQQEPQP